MVRRRYYAPVTKVAALSDAAVRQSVCLMPLAQKQRILDLWLLQNI